ncbi:hypothetical protein BLOT_000262 [Blomia tropicalis]|nr:hypothetical protein BLOT_000262 [Blomia tropicalis]
MERIYAFVTVNGVSLGSLPSYTLYGHYREKLDLRARQHIPVGQFTDRKKGKWAINVWMDGWMDQIYWYHENGTLNTKGWKLKILKRKVVYNGNNNGNNSVENRLFFSSLFFLCFKEKKKLLKILYEYKDDAHKEEDEEEEEEEGDDKSLNAPKHQFCHLADDNHRC